jgi:hemophore
MKTTGGPLRRGLYGVFATCLLGGAASIVVATPSATAATDPCAASEIARTIGSVATNTGTYLDAHPDTNAAVTSATQQQGPQAVATLKTYFDAHPQAGKDLQTIQQPLTGLAGKCKLPISLPQLLQFMQGLTQGGLPGAQSPVQNATPAAPPPAGPSAATFVDPTPSTTR